MIGVNYYGTNLQSISRKHPALPVITDYQGIHIQKKNTNSKELPKKHCLTFFFFKNLINFQFIQKCFHIGHFEIEFDSKFFSFH